MCHFDAVPQIPAASVTLNCEADPVMYHDVADIFNAAFKRFTPDYCARQPFGRHDGKSSVQEYAKCSHRSLLTTFVTLSHEPV